MYPDLLSSRAVGASSPALRGRLSAFTLIELLVVITIIAILMGLLFPVFKGAQTQAKRTQAKNDLVQLVTAVTAYYTEYGKYPLPAGAQGGSEDYTYSYDGTGTPENSDLIKILENDASASADNPRGIVFLNARAAKTANGYGVQPPTASKPFLFLDPWGRGYSICIDADYNGKVRERGTGTLITFGVIAWSLGEDGDWIKSPVASWR
ncbi:MAG: ral secretion pathway protein [Verrucomicrobiota bacterium]